MHVFMFFLRYLAFAAKNNYAMCRIKICKILCHKCIWKHIIGINKQNCFCKVFIGWDVCKTAVVSQMPVKLAELLNHIIIGFIHFYLMFSLFRTNFLKYFICRGYKIQIVRLLVVFVWFHWCFTLCWLHGEHKTILYLLQCRSKIVIFILEWL